MILLVLLGQLLDKNIYVNIWVLKTIFHGVDMFYIKAAIWKQTVIFMPILALLSKFFD